MSERVFIVAGTPSGKGRHRMTRTGHTYTPEATVTAEANVRGAYLRAYPRSKPHDGPVELSFDATFVVPASWPKWKRELAIRGLWMHTTRPDVDNVCKLLADSLNSVAWLNDTQLFDAHGRKCYGDVPRLIVRMRLLEQPAKP